MEDAAKKIVVTVAVLSGAVLCQLGVSPILLEAWENQAFASENDNHQTRGVVLATTDFSVKLRSEQDGIVTFYVPEKDKLAKHEVGQLLKGDQVTILWGREDGRKWVRNVAGAGVVEGNHRTRGVVAATSYFSVKLRSEEDGLVTFYVPEKDKLAKHEVGQLLTGDQVTILWGRDDGRKSVRDVAGE